MDLVDLVMDKWVISSPCSYSAAVNIDIFSDFYKCISEIDSQR